MLCPICCNQSVFVPEVSFKDMPLYQNQICPSLEEARSVSIGNIDTHVCSNCSFVFNASYSQLDYAGIEYNNYIPGEAYKTHMGEVVSLLSKSVSLNGKVVVEIGCGFSAFFLYNLIEENPGIKKAIGIDPCFSDFDTAVSRGVFIIKENFPTKKLVDMADVVICRHTVEHLKSPLKFIESLSSILRPGGILLIETPDVSWSIDNGIFWDFYYEHCSLFNFVSMGTALNLCGFTVVNQFSLYSGQYMVSISKKEFTNEHVSNVKTAFPSFSKMKSSLDTVKKTLSFEKVVLHAAAGGKGVSFCNILDKERLLVDCIVDSNPDKIGGFLPGTGHRIIAPGRSRVKYLPRFTLNDRYSSEDIPFIVC